MATHEEVSAAADARADQAGPHLAEVLEKVLQRRNLQVEPSPERRAALIQKRAGVKPPQAEAIANGADPKTLDLTAKQVEEVARLDIIDLLPIAFVEKARAAANAVGRLVTSNGTEAGTCFMISRELLITNNHVIPDAKTAEDRIVEFNFELDADGAPREPTRFRLDPAKFFVTNPLLEMDFTVVALGEHEEGPVLPEPAFCPLSDSGTKHALGQHVNLIQHPRGEPKQVVMRDNWLAYRTPTLLLYTGDTRPGSSGSPGFNDDWQVVVLHHHAGPSKKLKLSSGLEVPAQVNEGIRISAIVAALIARRDTLTPVQQELLDEALAGAVPAGV